ncbi:hypothetical protein COCNU_scaffold007932G000010 [Cocos nucifera]|nr:hypothetical protein [Cocos nucifera]
MKFGRVHDLPSTYEAELHLEHELVVGEAVELAAKLPIKGPDQEGMKFIQEGRKKFDVYEAAELTVELPIKGPDQEGMKFTQEGGKKFGVYEAVELATELTIMKAITEGHEVLRNEVWRN